MSNINPSEAKATIAADVTMGLIKMGTATEVVAQSPPPASVEVTATAPDEMEAAQSALIDWCRGKVAETEQDHHELTDAYNHAAAHKWATGALQRQTGKAKKRLDFYQKVLGALEAGYVIIPNFPVTAFAIRTDKTKPLRMLTTQWSKTHVQMPCALSAGEGEYKNPFPHVLERVVKEATTTTTEVKEYWANEWKDLAFPITMAKPTIMAAATRAMALKIFDDLSILPGYGEDERTNPPKGDPIIVARIFDPTRSYPIYGGQRHNHWITFMIAWHLSTKDL